MKWEKQLNDIIDFSVFKLSDIEPADWAEQNMKITTGNFQGSLSYDITPYHREIINCLSPFYPCTEVALMGAAQIGKTKAIIESYIAYCISEHPCEMGYLTGHSELSEESMIKLDSAIDNAGLRPLIKSYSLRKRNTRSGDTNKMKEFPMGNIVSGSATNHKLLRQRTWGKVIADDIEAAKEASKQSGDTISLIRLRTNSYGKNKKIFWCSTPELKESSIIEKLYLSGDQRKYHIPCQCCGTLIHLEWKNFIWETSNNILINDSVRYICQECGDSFDESNKYEFNLQGKWIATATPTNPDMVSFHLSGWYSAPGMDSWSTIVSEYLEACPVGGTIDKDKLKTWTNLRAGESFEENYEEIKANILQKNIQDYEIGIVPEKLSELQGNGKIVLLTCGADMNGILTDGRLDYEIVAHTQSGQTYSIVHGSIGTFVPAIIKTNEQKALDVTRDQWTYEEKYNHALCIWKEFKKLLQIEFKVDTRNTPRNMPIAITILDVGHLKNEAFIFIEKMINENIIVQGVKGRGNGEYEVFDNGQSNTDVDKRIIKRGLETNNLWSVEVGYLKDKLNTFVNLKWDKDKDEPQPKGFMNFPHPGGGLYEWNNFFEHFESEKRVLVANKTGKNVKAQWVKKASNSQNHLWDCRIYNLVGKEVWIEILKEKYKDLKDVNSKKIVIDWNWYVEGCLKLPWYQ